MRVLLGLLVLLAVAVTILPAESAVDPVTVEIEGPTAVAPRTPARYDVTVRGGPGEGNGTYHIEFYLEGAEVSGGTPLTSTKGQANNDSGTFTVDITAPTAETVFELVIVATSQNRDTNETETTTRTLLIESKTPILLRASFRNSGSVAVVGLEVEFFVDGASVGTAPLPRIDPGASASTNFSWVPIGLAEGEHAIRAEADLNGDGQIDPGAGEVSVSSAFVRRTGGLSTGTAVLLVAVVLAIGIFAILAFRARLRAAR